MHAASNRRSCQPARGPRSRPGSGPGFSACELVVGLSLGLVATLAAVVAFLGAHAASASIVEEVMLEIRGRHAIAMLASLIRQSGWTADIRGHEDDRAQPPGPALSGADDCGQPVPGDPLACGKRGVAFSDALQLRFGNGSLAPHDPSWVAGLMADCSGAPLVSATETGTGQVVTNLLYVGIATDGEPQLLCRHPTRGNGHAPSSDWVTAGLLRGVESFHLRYGVDMDGDGITERFVPARALPQAGWHRVTAVQLMLVLRSQRTSRDLRVFRDSRQSGERDHSPQALRLFPGNEAAEADDDTVFVPAEQPCALRRVFTTTVRLRNHRSCGETAC